MNHGRRISVIGLGYVGLPVAVAFASSGAPVIGYDVSKTRIRELREGRDRTNEVDPATLQSVRVRYTNDPSDLKHADFHIVAVPTPITVSRRPDLGALMAATCTVGAQIKRGDIIVFESTVYPGVTEDDCIPILETKSGLKNGEDFTVGYSPERINPGDKDHRFESITKVVAAQDPATCDVIAGVYGSVISAGVHLAPDIRTAEAAKVIENIQRDLNIALMNELSQIFARLGLDTQEVLDAAASKWNFVRFTPGLVGGHCIGVDPYYLTHLAERCGHHPEIILAGRRINDGMGRWLAGETIKRILVNGGGGRPRIIVLGLTFKEDVPDVRNTRVIDVIDELRAFGSELQVCDPLVDSVAVEKAYGIQVTAMDDLEPADAVVLTVPHTPFRDGGWPLIAKLLCGGDGLVVDVRASLDHHATPVGISLWRL
jgi:UDP-N-acetyl-D-galactosamine dehydrogenase